MTKKRLTILLITTLALLVMLVACSSPPEAPQEPTADSVEETEMVDTVTEGEELVEDVSDEAMAEADDEVIETEEDATEEETADVSPLPNDGPIDDDEAVQLMYQLLANDGPTVLAAMDRIIDADDQRFNSVFVEMLRAAQIGIVTVPQDHVAIALQMLSGEGFGNNWPLWIEWYGGTDLEPPPGFTSWKGDVLSRVDSGFAEFLRSEFPSTVRAEEIQWGGVRVDGIPALDHAPMITVAEATYLNPEDAVFGLTINGDSRAYPLRIVDWHEMANDTVGGVPVSIAYCTLCGAAIAYDGRASDGNTYDFGSSGFLFRSNKLMYDRQTRTLWNQLTGEPVLGVLVDSDVTLDYFPIVLTTWADWQAQHPDTLVLDVNTGFDRPYEPGAAYADYFASENLMFPVWQRSDLLDDKAQIYALRIDDMPKAYPIDVLTDELVVNDMLSDTNVVLVATSDPVTVSGRSVRMNEERVYSAGSEVRAYDRGDYEFGATNRPDVIVDQEGAVWEVTEDGLIGPDGQMLPRLSGHLAYWFGWFTFFPNTGLYSAP